MNPHMTPLNREAQLAYNKTINKLQELAFVDHTRLGKVNDLIAAEMKALKQQFANS